MKKLIGLVLALTLICFTVPVHAFNEPFLNLGLTNFMDASPGPGWYLTEYAYFHFADELKDGDGHELPGDNDLDIAASVTQIVYHSNVKFLGGNPGLDLLLPIAHIDFDNDLLGIEGQGGVGDLLVGPFIQWGPNMVFGRPYFQRFEFQILTPTGEHDNDHAINPGSGFWSIDPYYSFTYFITPKLETSWRIHYLWNAEKDNSGGRPDIQAGQAIHFNYAIDYAFTNSFRAGIAGYYLKQITEDEADGHNISDSEEQVFAIGPGLVWHINKDLTFMAAVNFEMAAEARPEGVASTLRLIWKFW